MVDEILKYRLETIKQEAMNIENSPANTETSLTKILDNVDAILAELDQDGLDFDEFN